MNELLIQFANLIKNDLEDLKRPRIFFAKGEISKRIDKILEDFSKRMNKKWKRIKN